MPDGPRARAARGRGAELRDEILQASMALLTETGDVAAVSVRAVARRVGVSVPSLYLHFADKQALIDAVCEQVFEALHLRMRAAGQGAGDPFEALRAQGNAYVHFALENPEHYRILMMTAHPDQAQCPDTAIASGAFDYLLASVEACREAGVYSGDPVEIALGLWTAAHGVAALLVVKQYAPWPDVDTFVDRTICVAGLGLAVAERLPLDPPLPLAELVARLDALRPTSA